MKHTVNWGIIGLGNIALEFAKSFNNVDNADLIAVASTTHQKLTKFKQEFNIKKENLYNNYEKLIENKEYFSRKTCLFKFKGSKFNF